ncbi:MAG TPA: ABC transporter permease [Desulfomonilaceae bacterium]|nr:ABC transporter permease [Desulfomonilaceae bacterium]
MSWYSFIAALEQGLIFGLMSLGVYLTFRVLDFPDLTVDGSLPLGASVSAAIVATGGDPFLSVAAAFVAGGLAGAFTGIISTKLRILNLLAGILTMIALYSINIRIMGSPNISFLNRSTLFDGFRGLGVPGYAIPMIVALVAVLALKMALDLFLHTRFGLALRATGDNPRMVAAQGVDTHTAIIAGVALSNALVAVSGALLAQSQGSADVNMGVGTIVAGLASVIIGEAFMGDRSVFVATASVILGSVLYRMAIAAALSFRFGALSLNPSDLNLITAILVIGALTLPRVRNRLKSRALK